MRKLSLLVMASLMSGFLFSQPSLKNLQKQLTAKGATAQSFDMNLLNDTRAILKANDAGYTTERTLNFLNTGLGLRKSNDEFKAGQLTSVSNGVAIQKYEQFYKGIKVEHGAIAMTTKQSAVQSVMLEFYSIPEELSIIPQIDEAAAFEKAKLYVAANKYPWDAQNNKPSTVKRPVGTLTILQDFYGKKHEVRLSYKFLMSSDEPISRSWIYVDAKDGRLLLIDRIIKHIEDPKTEKAVKVLKEKTDGLSNAVPVNALGSSETRYSGTQPFTTDFNGTVYNLREVSNAHNIITLDYARRVYSNGSTALATDFIDSNNVWTTAEHALNYDDAAHDVQFAMEFISNYWENVHGRHSWDNNYADMKSYVHIRTSTTAGYDNAFWGGDAMYYGDGTYYSANGLGTVANTGGFKPLTSLDVSAHELGHAVCQSTAGLVYQRESGGLNEGFSDIWAACVENFSGLPKNFWLIGEEIYPAFGALRSMSNPKAYNNPDTYGGANWSGTTLNYCPVPQNANDQCGVHNNSGVLNKWFYLVTVGANATNDLGNAYSVTGLGFVKSEQIAYLTELSLTPNADFAATRAASITAAETLFGACSNEAIQVTNAWFAVGVGASSTCLPTVEFSSALSNVSEGTGPAGTCSSTKVVNIPVRMPATSTQVTDVTVSLSGTATLNNDYTIASNIVSFAAGESGVKNVSLTIQDDASVETNETVILTFTVSNNGGEALAGVNNQTYTLTIQNDDIMPAIITAAPTTYPVLVSEDFEARPIGNVFPAGWLNGFYTNSALYNWAIGPNGGSGITGKSAYISTSPSSASPPFAYSADAGNAGIQDRIIRFPAMNTIGKKNLKLSFKYKVGGEYDAPSYSVYDFARIYYNPNGVNDFNSFPLFDPSINEPFLLYGDGTTANTFAPLSLPATMDNKTTVYAAFRWINDPFGGNGLPFLFDDLLITATSTNTGVESQATQSGSVNIRSGMDNYLVSAADSQLIARVRNPSENLSCVSAQLIQSGVNQIPLLTYTGSFQRTEKVIKISPAVANSTATWEGTLYFTTAELAAWGSNDVNLKILKLQDGYPVNGHVSNDNAVLITPTSVVKDAVNGVIAYTATFTGFSQFALVDQSTTLPVNFLSFEVNAIGRSIKVDWATAQEINNKGFSVERSTDGIKFESIGFVKGHGTYDHRSDYSYTDVYVQPGTVYYYRLRQQDYDGHDSFSVIKKASFEANGLLLSLSPNPASDKVRLFVSGNQKMVDLELVNAQGQVVRVWKQVNAFSTATSLNINGLTGGMYMLRLNWPDQKKTEKLMIR